MRRLVWLLEQIDSSDRRNINAKARRQGATLTRTPCFAGIPELGGIRTRHKVNCNFYGRIIHPTEYRRAGASAGCSSASL